jgi:hypothetical protein
MFKRKPNTIRNKAQIKLSKNGGPGALAKFLARHPGNIYFNLTKPWNQNIAKMIKSGDMAMEGPIN